MKTWAAEFCSAGRSPVSGPVMRAAPQGSVMGACWWFSMSGLWFSGLFRVPFHRIGRGARGRGLRAPGRGMPIFFRIFAQNPVLRPLLFISCRPQIFAFTAFRRQSWMFAAEKIVNFPRNAFQMRRNLPGFLRSADFCDFLSRRACPALRETTPAMRDSGGPCQQLLNTKNDSL